MSLSHRYRNFGASQPHGGQAQPIEAEQIEEDKLQSFEEGYKSGWDDAVCAQETTRANVSAEFARNLQEASFSYHEARSALVQELRNVIEPLMENLLPAIASETLAAHILDQITQVSRDNLGRPIEVAVSPTRVTAMQTIFEDVIKEPFVIVADDCMAADQVFLRVGQEEREVDFAPWLQEVKDGLSAYFDSIGKE